MTKQLCLVPSQNIMSTRAQKTDATHRLEDMTTQEVSLVDRAANLRTFLTLKSEDQTNMPTDTQTEQNKALALPPQARDTLVEGVADALEKLTGVTQAIKESTTDDAAEVPAELPQMIKEASDLLAKVAAKFMTDGGSDASAESSESNDSDADDTEKNEGILRFCEKARRMTGNREAKLKELASMLRAFGAEFGVDLTEQAAEIEGEAAETEKSDDAKATLDVVTGLVSAVGSLADKVDAIGKSAEGENKKTVDALTEQVAALKKSIEAPGESNSHAAESDEPAPGPKPFAWPTDMSAHVAKKLAAENG